MSIATVEETQRVKSEKKSAIKNFKVDPVIDAILPQFDNMIRSYTVFNAFFLSLGILEFLFLVIFFTFLAQSAVLATSLALVFLTFFSYFILKLYLQAKQPEQYQEIKERYIKACKSLINYHEGTPEHYVALADSCTRFAERLQNKENTVYTLPEYLNFLLPYLQKFSSWCHSDDVLNMQEMLLQTAIEENIKLVKCAPTTLSAHASLANAYMALACLYKGQASNNGEYIMTENPTAKAFQAKYQSAAQKAISELNIVLEISDREPWAHLQLADIYRELKMTKDEIREYESYLKINPDDDDALCRLGKLYFQLSMNGPALKIYEQLKQKNDRRADELIKFYGASSV